jgi:hypothetical protein
MTQVRAKGPGLGKLNHFYSLLELRIRKRRLHTWPLPKTVPFLNLALW